MSPVLWTLAIVGPLWLAAAGTFIAFVISMHRTRRTSLHDVAGEKRGALSRKAFVTTRSHSARDGE